MYSLELGVNRYSINDLSNIFNDYYTKRSAIHGFQTRHVNDLKLTKNNNYYYKTLFWSFRPNERFNSTELYRESEKKKREVCKTIWSQYKQNLISN